MALEGRRDPRTGKRSPESRPGEARLGVRQFPPGKAKDGGAETQSLVLKGAGRIENWSWGARAGPERSEPAIPVEMKRRSRSGVGAWGG